jgi:hypothetical protein
LSFEEINELSVNELLILVRAYIGSSDDEEKRKPTTNQGDIDKFFARR